MRAMVLAAGLGTRLRPITYAIPKPMVPVVNRPVMEHMPEAAGPARLPRDDRQPALVPGDDRGPLRRRVRFRPRAHLQPRGAPARHRRRGAQRGRLPGRLVPGRRGRRAHRPRLHRDARVPRVPRRAGDGGDEAGRRHRPVRGRDHRRRRPHPGLPGEAGPRRGALRPGELAASTCSAPRSSTTSRRRGRSRAAARRTRPSSPTGRWTSSRRLLEGDLPFYSHETDAYWNDIGNLAELRQSNLDALTGAVAVEPGAPEVADGVRSATPLDGVEVTGPGADRRGSRARRGRPHRRPGDRR